MAEQRIQKVLADQGICSRREAERLIAAGKVKVNGHPVTLGDKMDPDYDKVMIDGQTQRIVRKRQYTYIMLHKPRGYLTTRQIRRMCSAVGLQVVRLRRSAEGPVKLGMLQPGEYRELKKSEINALRNAAMKSAGKGESRAASPARRPGPLKKRTNSD